MTTTSPPALLPSARLRLPSVAELLDLAPG